MCIGEAQLTSCGRMSGAFEILQYAMYFAEYTINAAIVSCIANLLRKGTSVPLYRDSVGKADVIIFGTDHLVVNYNSIRFATGSFIGLR